MNRWHRWYCQSSRWEQRLKTEVLPWSLAGVDLAGEVLELGPGPGLTTDWLLRQCGHLTCLELDPRLARALRERHAGALVAVHVGDATAMPFREGEFSTVLAFTMLHHVSSPDLQDRLFREAFRVLQPGGTFAGSDGMGSLWMRIIHLADTLVPLDPQQLPRRLEAAGFREVSVDASGGRLRFRARRPPSSPSGSGPEIESPGHTRASA